MSYNKRLPPDSFINQIQVLKFTEILSIQMLFNVLNLYKVFLHRSM